MATSNMTLYNLIDVVRERPEIWQFSHPMNRNRVVHKRFWRAASKQFGLCEQLLKKRWKHLKDQYRKELKKVTQKGLPEDTVPWKYYEALSFLKEDVVHREKERFILAANSDNDESEGEEKDLLQSTLKQSKRISGLVLNKKDDSEKLNTILKRVSETKAIVENRMREAEDWNRNDPDYLFLMSILPSMRHLNEIQKLHFKSKVNDWMLQVITNNTYGSPCVTETHVIAEVKTELTE